jgi:hypothetical protein
MPKAAGYEYIRATVNRLFETNFSSKQIGNRVRNLRQEYSLIRKALRESGCGGMDEKTWTISPNDQGFWARMKEVRPLSLGIRESLTAFICIG